MLKLLKINRMKGILIFILLAAPLATLARPTSPKDVLIKNNINAIGIGDNMTVSEVHKISTVIWDGGGLGKNMTKTELLAEYTKTELPAEYTKTELHAEYLKSAVPALPTKTELAAGYTKTELTAESSETELPIESTKMKHPGIISKRNSVNPFSVIDEKGIFHTLTVPTTIPRWDSPTITGDDGRPEATHLNTGNKVVIPFSNASSADATETSKPLCPCTGVDEKQVDAPDKLCECKDRSGPKDPRVIVAFVMTSIAIFAVLLGFMVCSGCKIGGQDDTDPYDEDKYY